MATRVQAIFFDTLGTLWELEPGLDERVAAACRARELDGSMAEVRYQRVRLLDELRLGFSDGQYKTEAQAQAYWREFYERLLAALDVPAEQLGALAGELLAGQFDPASYRLYADVRPALEELRRAGLTLGVIANHKGPERQLLEAFGLADCFAHCLISSELGTEKPESRVFAMAADQAGVAPEALLYAGNDPLEDMTGAEVAGCQAVLVDRGERYSTSYLQWRRVRRLDEIARVLATPSAVLE